MEITDVRIPTTRTMSDHVLYQVVALILCSAIGINVATVIRKIVVFYDDAMSERSGFISVLEGSYYSKCTILC